MRPVLSLHGECAQFNPSPIIHQPVLNNISWFYGMSSISHHMVCTEPFEPRPTTRRRHKTNNINKTILTSMLPGTVHMWKALLLRCKKKKVQLKSKYVAVLIRTVMLCTECCVRVCVCESIRVFPAIESRMSKFMNAPNVHPFVCNRFVFGVCRIRSVVLWVRLSERVCISAVSPLIGLH